MRSTELDVVLESYFRSLAQLTAAPGLDEMSTIHVQPTNEADRLAELVDHGLHYAGLLDGLTDLEWRALQLSTCARIYLHARADLPPDTDTDEAVALPLTRLRAAEALGLQLEQYLLVLRRARRKAAANLHATRRRRAA